MREYLAALGPLLRGEAVKYRGETLSATATVSVPGALAPSLVVAALGPVMLDLAGELADGTVTWMTGPATVADHIVPTITMAASRAGRPAPRVIVGMPFCVTGDPADARARAATQLARYALMPSYRAMLDREGAGGPADIVVVGDEEAVRAAVRRVSDAGATELLAVTLGTPDERARTRAVLADIVTR